jgi:hypothetical protein
MPIEEPNEILQFIRVDPQTGAITPRWWRRDVMPFCLTWDEQSNTTNYMSLAATGTPSPPAVFKLQHSSAALNASHDYNPYQLQNPLDPNRWPVEIQGGVIGSGLDPTSDLGNPLLIDKLVCRDNLQTSNFPNYTIMLKDMGDRTQFMNQPIQMNHFAGSSQQPAWLKAEPLFLPTRHDLIANFVNSGIATTFRLDMWGQMFYVWSQNLLLYPMDREIMISLVRRYLIRRQYVYPFWLTSELAISLSGFQQNDYEALIGDDGHFEATHWMAFSTSLDAGSNPAAFSFEIVDPDTNETVSNGQFDSEVAGGNANFPQELPVPLLVPAGRRLVFRVANKCNSTNNIFITLRGRKIRAPLTDWATVAPQLEVPANPDQPFDTKPSVAAVRNPVQKNLVIAPVGAQ